MIDLRFYSLSDTAMTVADICARLDLVAPEGSFADTVIRQPVPLSRSNPGDISFLASVKHVSALETANGSACFVTEAVADEVAARNIVPIVCKSPKYELSRATSLLVRPSETAPNISPTANIHPSVHIGLGVVIGDNVKIGPNSVITHAVIGNNVSIGACTVIGGDGFGVSFGPDGEILPVPHVGRVTIGDNVRLGSNVCIDRGQLGDTVISESCHIDNLVQIGHNCVLERGCLLAGRVGLSGSCHIGAGVMMGGSVGLADHITIGAGAKLAAFAGVMQDVPEGQFWSGIPAMPIREHMKIVAQAKRALRK
jgi:UDP-3-O-[3-hydroxymyristoyl] glucosamine N-acyltransferase